MNTLKLIVMDNMKELGNQVLKELDGNYQLHCKNSRFSNGEGKVVIENEVRNQDIYILTDVGNYHCSYDMHGMKHFMSPDEHFQDVKRVVSAIGGYANRITVVMPLLYASRQHKRKGRESLDCAIALQELERIGVNHIVTFDCHDPNVSNAIPNLPFENIYPTTEVIRTLKKEQLDDVLVVSPDMGAMERARYYAEMLNSDVGVFYKRRDLSKIVNGKNPIVEHVYMGPEVKDKNILIVDDMIASGTSMLEVAKELKNRGAKKIYMCATFSLFTEGTMEFEKYYQEGIFDELFSTNLSYVPNKIKKKKWYHEINFGPFLTQIIVNLHENREVMEGTEMV